MSSGLQPSSHYLSTIEEVASGANSPLSSSPAMHDDSDDEGFVYPGTEEAQAEFVYPGAEEQEQPQAAPSELSPPRAGTPTPEPLVHAQQVQSPVPSKSHPTPAQLEALHAAAASGDLRRIQTEFRKAVRSDDVDPFELANDASPRTGLTALHAAASRGYLDIVKWRTFRSFYLVCTRLNGPLKLWRSAGPFPILRTRKERLRCTRPL
ncbi:hypothetical protein OH77DRAFT_738629 [Trametes cingulata]|nr:hypothetical protein OH77DRAFT_738629 [Trametes cingulata]